MALSILSSEGAGVLPLAAISANYSNLMMASNYRALYPQKSVVEETPSAFRAVECM